MSSRQRKSLTIAVLSGSAFCLGILAGGVQAATVIWDGSTDMTWSQPDSTSWSGGTFNSGDVADFTGLGQGTVTVDGGGVTPSQTNVTSGTYIFTGGSIGGTGGLAISTAGTSVTLNNANSYSGLTTVGAGTTLFANGSNSSAGGTTVFGTLVLGSANPLASGTLKIDTDSVIRSDGASNRTIANRLAFNVYSVNPESHTFGSVGTGDLHFTSNINTEFAHNKNQIFIINNAQTTIDANLRTSSGNSNAILTKRGSGRLVLNGNLAAVTGTVRVPLESGTLALNGINDIRNSVEMSPGTTLEIGSNTPVGSNANAGIRFNSNSSSLVTVRSTDATHRTFNARFDFFGGGIANHIRFGSSTTGNLTINPNGTQSAQASTQTMYVDNQVTTLNHNFAGTLGITKRGAGKLVLGGTSSYSGATTVSEGTLLVNGSITSNTGVAAGATLGGSGVIDGTVTLNGTAHLAPGASVGTLTGDTLTLSAGNILDYEFNGSSNDLFVVANPGGLTINGAIDVNLYEENTLNPLMTSGTYHLIRYTGALGGSIAGLAIANPIPDLPEPYGYSFALSSDGEFNYVDVVVFVPEPTSAASLLLAGLLMTRLRRGRKDR